MTIKINKEITVQSVRDDLIQKAVNVTLPGGQAYQFLVDAIANSGTLNRLRPLFRSTPAGNLDALSIGRRNLRLADDDSNTNPTGVGSIGNRSIPYAVVKVFWDEWIKNDDVIYNAIREANNLSTQEGITATADLEDLIIQMLQKQFATDLQDLAFNGNKAYPEAGDDSAFLRTLNGFVIQMDATENKTDILTREPEIVDFLNHISTLPAKYKDNFASEIIWGMRRSTHDKLMVKIANRETGFGDAVIQNGLVTRLGGYDIEIVQGMEGKLINDADASAGRRGFAFLTPRSNLVPVFTMDLKYNRTGDGALALKKDSTYHIIHAYMDVIIREVNAVAVMEGDKL